MGSVRMRAVADTATAALNVVVIRGRVSRTPERRELASGVVLVAYELATPSAERGARTGTVPVVWPSAPAAASVGEGDEVVVVGGVRRRFFRAGGVIQSRTEVVAEQVVPVRQRAKAARALAEATARLAGV